jgi:DnaK suppressor protein
VSNIEKIKKKLLTRRQEILQSSSINKLRDDHDDDVKDPADEAFSVSQEELGISLHNNEINEYNRINKALQMIDQGTYGLCTECGKEISERRLQFYPNATLCVSCQEALESYA